MKTPAKRPTLNAQRSTLKSASMAELQIELLTRAIERAGKAIEHAENSLLAMNEKQAARLGELNRMRQRIEAEKEIRATVRRMGPVSQLSTLSSQLRGRSARRA